MAAENSHTHAPESLEETVIVSDVIKTFEMMASKNSRTAPFRRPNRMFMEDPNIQWRDGKPDYSKADRTYLEGN